MVAMLADRNTLANKKILLSMNKIPGNVSPFREPT